MFTKQSPRDEDGICVFAAPSAPQRYLCFLFQSLFSSPFLFYSFFFSPSLFFLIPFFPPSESLPLRHPCIVDGAGLVRLVEPMTYSINSAPVPLGWFCWRRRGAALVVRPVEPRLVLW